MNNIDKITSYMHNVNVEEYANGLGITLNDAIKEYCQTFLIITDHIPNKIVESLIENLADATALNFITVFIRFIADVRIHYNDVLKLRKWAREEINRLEGETEGETA